MIRLGSWRDLASGSTSHDQELAGVADEVNPAIRNSVKLMPFEKAFGARTKDSAVRKMAGRETLTWLGL
jgi:hypothetical protein